MAEIVVMRVVKTVVPVVAGAVGTYLLTAYPAVYATMCGG